MNRQQDLFHDLPRGDQLAALRRIKLDSWTVGNAVVSGVIQKSVLRVIDDHDGGRGCFTTQQTIAEEIGCSRASVGRAIAALIDRDLITSERPNHWSPNHHRINWTALHQIDASTAKCATSTAHSDASGSYVCDVGELSSSGPLPHGESRNAQETQVESPPSTATLTDEWLVMRRRLTEIGMKAATQATVAARDRGLSIEFIEELILAATVSTGHEPAAGVGWLCHWLTGKADPPFDEAESSRRRDERDRRDQSAAESIRQSVIQSGRAEGAATWLAAGITFRKLCAAGLERFTTADEVAAGAKMDEIDRQRGADQPKGEKRAPDVDAHSVKGTSATSQPGITSNALGANFKPRSVPGTGIHQRRRELDQALAAIA